METRVEPVSTVIREPESRAALSLPPGHAEYIFRLDLQTILCAHLYGHLTEAAALRAIAKAMQECFGGEIVLY